MHNLDTAKTTYKMPELHNNIYKCMLTNTHTLPTKQKCVKIFKTLTKLIGCLGNV